MLEIKYRTRIGTLIHNGTYGSILYIDANKKLAEDNDGLYYDPVNVRVGIGTNTPNKALHVAGTTSDHYIQTDTGLLFDTVIPPSTPATVTLLEVVGNITPGSHRYFVSFVTAIGETQATAFTDYIVADATHGQVQISNIPTSSDYRVTARRIYRTIATSAVFHFKLLATLNDNVTTDYLDNVADGSLTGGTVYPGYYYLPNTTNDIIFVDGERALLANTMNTSLGISALESVTVPSYGNSVLGFEAGKNLTTGNANTLVGITAGRTLTTGGSCTFIGAVAGYFATGNHNVLIGAYAGYGITSGITNTFVGNGTGFTYNVSGCVFLGYNAGRSESGNNKLYISNTDTNNPLIYGDFSTFRVGLGTTSPNANLSIENRNSTNIGFSIRAAASQSANLLQATDNPGTTIFEVQADGEVALIQDSKKLYFGAGYDFSLYYDGADANIKTDEVTASDLLIHTGSQKTIELQTVVYNDINFNALYALPGATAPDLITLNSTGFKGYAFNGVNLTEELQFGEQEILHGYKEGTDIYLHIHWRPTTSDTGNVKWQVEYYWDNIDSTPGSNYTVSLVDAAGGVAWQHLKTDEYTISGTGKLIGSHLLIRVFRDPTDSADTYAYDAVLSSVGVHYQIDTIGSRQVNIK